MRKLLNRNSLRPSQFVLIGDQILFVLGLATSILFYYRFVGYHQLPSNYFLFDYFLLQISLGIAAWLIFGINKKVIRYFTSKDFLFLIVVVALVHLFSFAITRILPIHQPLRVEIFIFSFFTTKFYIVGSRFIIHFLFFHYNKTKRVVGQKNLLIYGAGELGVFLKNSMHTHYKDQYRLVAFLDDDQQKIGRVIDGLKVLDPSNGLKKIIKKFNITDVFIANKTMAPQRKSQFLETVLPQNIKVREIASIQSLFTSNFNIDKLATVNINDLLNRKPILLYDEHVSKVVNGKTVLVTGAAGSIGSEIVRKLSEHGASKIVCLDFSESALYDLEQELIRNHPQTFFVFVLADIRNEGLLEKVFVDYSLHFIYHAAAYKHVPMMEEYPWEAVQTNIYSTFCLAKLAIKHKVEKFVFISSDKAVNPTSVMGATKRLAELIIQAYSSFKNSTQFAITRFGNVLGSNGSVVPLFKNQIQNGGPVTVTHPEMVRYFMTIPEACQLVLEASVMAEGGEIFVFDMGDPVKIVDLAKNMILLAGFVPDVDIKIKIIGQRPGEKLYEEIFFIGEKMKETHHEKILISKENVVPFEEAQQIIEKLKSLDGLYQPDLYRVVLKDLLPEFQVKEINSKLINFTTRKQISENLN
jgi:FlaA1/EpsC-like NDP-sugar epimerase